MLKSSVRLVMLSLVLWGTDLTVVYGQGRGFVAAYSARQLVAANTVMIWNSSGQRIGIFLSARDGQESLYDLGPNDALTFRDEGAAQFQVRIVTEAPDAEREVHYTLNAKSRYKLYWNNYAHRWDVASLSSRR